MSRCGYSEDGGWSPPCQNERPCEKHGHLMCVECGEPAAFGCSHDTGWNAICGRPLCREHRGSCTQCEPRRPKRDIKWFSGPVACRECGREHASVMPIINGDRSPLENQQCPQCSCMAAMPKDEE